MGQKKKQRTEQHFQRVHDYLLTEHAGNKIQDHNLMQLIKAGKVTYIRPGERKVMV